MSLHSVQTAFASKVFPVPGGPHNNIPFLVCLFINNSGLFIGNWIVEIISSFSYSIPPMSSQFISGIFAVFNINGSEDNFFYLFKIVSISNSILIFLSLLNLFKMYLIIWYNSLNDFPINKLFILSMITWVAFILLSLHYLFMISSLSFLFGKSILNL